MIKTINGVRYNTESSTFIAGASGGGGRSDFHFWEEELYVTQRSGRYFIAGEGGAMSRWSESCGQNQWCGGSGIKPITKKMALEWCEQNDISEDIIEHYFGDMIQEA